MLKFGYIGGTLSETIPRKGFVMKEKNWSYLAGIVDGEGCITISTYQRTHALDGRGHGPFTYLQNELVIGIVNTSLSLMKWLVSNFGGVYYTHNKAREERGWKHSYLWRPKGAKNKEKFLLGILPYLIIKREQALIALEFLRLPRIVRGPMSATSTRTALGKKIRLLNRRGAFVETNTPNSAIAENIESDLIGDNESAELVIATA